MKGRKTGGRVKGSANKATIERAEAIATNLKKSGQTSALDELRELYRYHKSKGAQYQPVFSDEVQPDGKVIKRQVSGDEAKSREHLSEAKSILIAILPYESPKLQSTTIRNDAPTEPLKVQIEII